MIQLELESVNNKSISVSASACLPAADHHLSRESESFFTAK